jgi:hypothetical protein
MPVICLPATSQKESSTLVKRYESKEVSRESSSLQYFPFSTTQFEMPLTRRTRGKLPNTGQAIFAISLVLIPGTTYGYVGPGLGLGTVGIVLGVLGSIVLALFAVLWYPFKRLLKKNKRLLKKNQPPKEKESTGKDPKDDDSE